MDRQAEKIKRGGNPERQRRLGRLTVRERLNLLLDCPETFFELNLYAAFGMYEKWGEFPAAGVVTGIGEVSGRVCMVIANDATVKAGAMLPQSVKKVLRAQRIAFECRLPLLYLVDSSGVFIPLQEDVFPDEDDFGRIFRNNAVLSSLGIPQIAAIMGNCIAGGGYLPVLCDQLLMTEGSGLYLAGPALVKAAIGQEVDSEVLGGAKMHAEVSGTVDYLEKDDPSCLKRLRSLVEALPKSEVSLPHSEKPQPISSYTDTRELIAALTDSFEEYKADFGQALVTGFAKLGGISFGIVANQCQSTTTGTGHVEMGKVLYPDSADKGARFVMNCNQAKVPLLFLQDVVGFMVGKEAEQAGIIRSGAKLVNAVSNSIVPKITLIVGDSFGAGNYALCGKAYDPNFILAWPNTRLAVMGAEQAGLLLKDSSVKDTYLKQMDIRYAAARGWVDAIIEPEETRNTLHYLLSIVQQNPLRAPHFHTGVLQV